MSKDKPREKPKLPKRISQWDTKRSKKIAEELQVLNNGLKVKP